MENKQIAAKFNPSEGVESLYKCFELVRQDEREKWRPHLLDSVLTDAEFKEYTGSEREKMQGVDVSKMSEMLRSNSKETWIAAKGSDEGWNTWWKKRNQLNTN